MYSTNSNSQVVVKHIKKRKIDLISVFGSKCCICGFNAYPQALEFHHVHPQEKQFGITASNAITKALDKQLAEMKKCILVCANCHRGIHQNYIQIPQNWKQLFNEQRAEELTQELYNKTHRKQHYCSRCGKPTGKGAQYCVECGHLIQQKCDRPPREELKKMIRTMPFTTIAKQYNVSDNAIRKWCDKYNLPRKKTEINKYSNQEWENI